MEIKDWGEEGFIEHLMHRFSSAKDSVGIGDDCAVIPSEKESWLITTDALVEDIHFIREQIPPTELGYKILAVNISDIAAKGGDPKYAFLTMAIPENLDTDWLNQFTEGLQTACQKWRVFLLGGDTVRSKKGIFLNLTLIGSANPSEIKYRDTAMPGDIICVTGYLGDSGGGLKALREGIPQSEEVDKLLQAHFHPEPDPMAGKWLAAHDGVHAMMDISDGLHCDLRRLLAASKCGGEIELSQLPISPALQKACWEQGWDAIHLALAGGEDYCLLCTVEEKSIENVEDSFQKKFNKSLFPIGKITKEAGRLEYQKEGRPISLEIQEFKHF